MFFDTRENFNRMISVNLEMIFIYIDIYTYIYSLMCQSIPIMIKKYRKAHFYVYNTHTYIYICTYKYIFTSICFQIYMLACKINIQITENIDVRKNENITLRFDMFVETNLYIYIYMYVYIYK